MEGIECLPSHCFGLLVVTVVWRLSGIFHTCLWPSFSCGCCVQREGLWLELLVFPWRFFCSVAVCGGASVLLQICGFIPFFLFRGFLRVWWSVWCSRSCHRPSFLLPFFSDIIIPGEGICRRLLRSLGVPGVIFFMRRREWTNAYICCQCWWHTYAKLPYFFWCFNRSTPPICLLGPLVLLTWLLDELSSVFRRLFWWCASIGLVICGHSGRFTSGIVFLAVLMYNLLTPFGSLLLTSIS